MNALDALLHTLALTGLLALAFTALGLLADGPLGDYLDRHLP